MARTYCFDEADVEFNENPRQIQIQGTTKNPGSALLQELATSDLEGLEEEGGDLPDGTHGVTVRKRERW
jgi:hypothetical protein